MIGTWTLGDVAQVLGLSIEPALMALPFQRVCTDTRALREGDLFVCLRGERFDAHDFVAQARAAGAVAAVCERQVEDALPQLQVDSTLTALGQLGRANRMRFPGLVCAVTGSCGKTTVKEMLATLFSTRATTLATRGNLNNEIGAPLTLLELNDSHQFAVIELGASAQGEIAYTAGLTQPLIAILNNAQAAHIEGFGSLEGVVRAKAEIYSALPEGGTGIVNLDDPHAGVWLQELVRLQRRVMTFSQCQSDADVWLSDVEAVEQGGHRFRVHHGAQTAMAHLPLPGRHNLANAAAALAAWVAAGLPLQEGAEALLQCQPVKGRMHPSCLADGTLLIDDSYNANPHALRAAIDYLAARPGLRVLVLGDMAELGADAARQHYEAGVYACQCGIDRLLATGPLMQEAVRGFRDEGGEAFHYRDQPSLVTDLKQWLGERVTLLVKGSRSAAMDRVVSALLKGES